MKLLSQWKWNKDSFLILILAGILLFIIILPTEQKEELNQEKQSGIDIIEKQETTNTKEDESYEKKMEDKLGKAIQYIEGVGQTKVIITYESSAETIIEKDKDIDQSKIIEKDNQGGEREEEFYKNTEDTIYETSSNGDQEPYIVKTILPKVEGVVIICQGGGSKTVEKNLTEVIQALFGIEPHKIKVVKMKS